MRNRIILSFGFLSVLVPSLSFGAITFDKYTNGGYNAGTSLNFNHILSACSNSGLIISIHNDGGDGINNVTWNGVSTSQVSKQILTGNQNGQADYIYFSSSTDSGTHTISISGTQNGITGQVVSYCGINPVVEGTSTNQTNGTHLQVSYTTQNTNDWLVMGIRNSNGGTNTPDSGTFTINGGDANGIGMVHASETIAQAYTLGITFTNAGANQVAGELVALSPFTTSTGGGGNSTSSCYTGLCMFSTSTDAALGNIFKMSEILITFGLVLLIGSIVYKFVNRNKK